MPPYRPENYAKPDAYAHTMVQRAIRVGSLPKASHCEACGLTAADAKPARGARKPMSFVWHHWSLAARHVLDVISLCRACHSRVHKGLIPEPRTGRVYRTQTDWQRPLRGAPASAHDTGGEPVTVINRPRKRAA